MGVLCPDSSIYRSAIGGAEVLVLALNVGPRTQIASPNGQFHHGDGVKSLLSSFPKEAFAAQLKAELGCRNTELVCVSLLSPGAGPGWLCQQERGETSEFSCEGDVSCQ